MKRTIWALWFVLGMAIIWHLSGYRNVRVGTLSGEIYIPSRDVQRLEYLFRELIIYNSVGYTLIGNKPTSFESFSKPSFEWDLVGLWHAFSLSNLKKYHAWKTWQKYAHLFNKGDVLIWSEPSPWIKNGELIVVASQKQLKRARQENQEDFASLQNLEPQALFRECLLSHEGLLGILLGYGRTNAWLFYENNHFLLKPIFSDELNELFKTTKAALNFTFGWPTVEMAEILMFPNFMADINTEETKRLRSDYIQTRQKILDYYQGKDFLEATFQLMEK